MRQEASSISVKKAFRGADVPQPQQSIGARVKIL
jgi:hypothetical protein